MNILLNLSNTIDTAFCVATLEEAISTEAGRTMRCHIEGIVNRFRSLINNGILEGLNSLIQAVKARARGCRTDRNLITIIYLTVGRLSLALPT